MPRRKQKTISLDEEAFHYLSQARANLEKITRVKMSWEAFFLATSTGSLAIAAIAGAHIRCPVCEHEMGLSVRGIDVVDKDERRNRHLDSICRT
jgi:hypothetical protein